MEVDINLIAAVDENLVIGNDGSIPWNIPKDLQHFEERTTGHPVVMGRTTYESIVRGQGESLTDRPNVVLTSRDSLEVSTPDRTTLVSSVEEALEVAKEKAQPKGTVFIGGGENVYKAFLPHATEMVLTYVEGEYEGDTYFPEWNTDEWEQVTTESYSDFRITTYKHR